MNSQHCAIFCNRKSTQREPLRKGAGTGSTRYGKQEIQAPYPPPPPQIRTLPHGQGTSQAFHLLLLAPGEVLNGCLRRGVQLGR